MIVMGSFESILRLTLSIKTLFFTKSNLFHEANKYLSDMFVHKII